MKYSLEIHLQSCIQKFKDESNQFRVKRKVPPRPKELSEVNLLTFQILNASDLTVKAVIEYNKIASKEY